MILPQYPVYVPSKGRATTPVTASFLLRDRVPFFLVVEPREEETYRLAVPDAELLILPENDQGLVFARNWIREHSSPFARHWQLDDNIRGLLRWWKGCRIPCDAGLALRSCEDFTDRYENIAIAGLNYEMFATSVSRDPPFRLNCHVYSISLIDNSIPYHWRLAYNDDTDLCLQALAGGWCTVQLNAFLASKIRTMALSGGNTDDLYQGDGRCVMSRTLERQWPGVVKTTRRFNRPQHVIDWAKFKAPLIRKADPPPVPDYGIRLVQVADEIRSPELRQLLAEYPQGS